MISHKYLFIWSSVFNELILNTKIFHQDKYSRLKDEILSYFTTLSPTIKQGSSTSLILESLFYHLMFIISCKFISICYILYTSDQIFTVHHLQIIRQFQYLLWLIFLIDLLQFISLESYKLEIFQTNNKSDTLFYNSISSQN